MTTDLIQGDAQRKDKQVFILPAFPTMEQAMAWRERMNDPSTHRLEPDCPGSGEGCWWCGYPVGAHPLGRREAVAECDSALPLFTKPEPPCVPTEKQ